MTTLTFNDLQRHIGEYLDGEHDPRALRVAEQTQKALIAALPKSLTIAAGVLSAPADKDD